ncbi:MAG: SDR family oxidoreductase [Pseudomonadota bacterium]
MNQLNNQTVVITGASRGIGEATARHLAACGANVVLAARNQTDIERIAEDIRGLNGNAIAKSCDVTQYDEVAQVIDTALTHYGNLDVLVNNAGIIEPIARIEDIDPADWTQVIDTNVKGVFFGIRAAIPVMLEAGSGTIINISSGAAHSALEGWSHYCASKAAVLSLTRCTHREFGERGIDVVGISPGTVTTQVLDRIRESDMNRVSRLPDSAHIPAEWVAKGIEFLCRGGAKQFAGDDFSLKTDEGRTLAGLPPVNQVV